MQTYTFSEFELSGARVTVPFTALKHFGPKHHAIVIGIRDGEEEIWIAELSRKHGYRLVSLKSWLDDNKQFEEGIEINKNEGPRTNWEVAQGAIEDVIAAKENGHKYNVIFNNCETFADRHQTGTTGLSPQVKKAMKLAGFVVAGGAMILKRHIRNRSELS